MPSRTESWGIEVGAQAIKAVHLSRTGNGVELLDFETVPYKQVLTAPDVNAEQLIQEALQTLIQKHELGRATTVASVPGSLSFARFASLPPVDDKKLPQIVRYEAQQQIPFPIEEVEWDYKVFKEEDSPEVKAGIFAITKEQVLQYLANFRRLDIRVDEMTLSSLGVYNGLMYDEPVNADGDGVIYVDISTRSTDLIFVEGGSIWIRTLPIGGNTFTEAIARAFQVSFAKAEQIKKEAASKKYTRPISQAIRSDLANLQQEIQRSIGYYQSLNRDANLTKIVGLGSTFRLPGLRTVLKKNLDMEVVKPEGYNKVSIDGPRSAELADSALNLTTAYGLALQGVGLADIDCNIMPRFILAQRLWKAKQPWFAAGAACLAAAAGAVAFSHMKDASAGDEAAQRQTDQVIRQARNYTRELQEVQAENQQPLINNFMRLVDYRDLYPKLYNDILAAAATQPASRPSPDPKLNRFYLEWVDVAYTPKPEGSGDDATASSGQSAAATSLEDKFGTPLELSEFFPAAQEASADMDPYAEAESEEASDGSETKDVVRGPRLIVTASVVVPQAQADSRNFVAWLQANADRPDRPYRFIVDPKTALRFQESLNDSASERATGGRGVVGGRMGGMDPRMGDMTMGRPTDPRMGTTSRGNNARTSTGAIADMLPTRSETNDPKRMGGQLARRLIIQWEVEIKPPAEARQELAATAQLTSAPMPLSGNDALAQANQTQATKPERVEDAS